MIIFLCVSKGRHFRLNPKREIRNTKQAGKHKIQIHKTNQKNEPPTCKQVGIKRKIYIEKPMVSQTLPCKVTDQQAGRNYQVKNLKSKTALHL